MPNTLPRFLRETPAGLIATLCLALLLGLSLSLTRQALALHQLLQEPRIVPAAPRHAAPPPDLARMAMLFGPTSPSSEEAPRTNLQLRLLSSFSHPQPERASALIAAEGAPAQLFRIGDSVVPGVTLGEVHSRYVTLLRNQRSELLHFPTPPGR
jgi:hypothetical protein